MLILALETSGMGGSIALLEDAAILGERILDAERRHARTLVPEIKDLLRQHGRSARDCQLLAVSVGPGSFTGLRVGIACAKTLAYATGARIAAIPTFQAIAQGCPPTVSQVQVAMNAQRQELFVGRYQRTPDGNWHESHPLKIERTAEWIEALQPTDWVTGPGLEGLAETLQGRCQIVPADHWQPQARAVGHLGWQASLQDRLTTCWELLPLYVRKSAAEEKADLAAQQSPS